MKTIFLKSFLILFILLFAPHQRTVAQENGKVKEQLLEAESDFLYEEFSDALPIYMKLRDRFPDNAYLEYKIGRCYLNNPFEKKKSIVYLQQAMARISHTDEKGSFKQNLVPLEVLYYLGDAYRVNNQLEKALDAYEKFKQQLDTTTFDLNLVNDQIQACKRAMVNEKDPVDVTWQNLGDVINTRFSETHPVVSEAENVMLYATQLPFYQAVFFTKKINGKWQQPVNIIPDLGIDGDCLPTCLSADGTEAYFYRSDQFLGDLYVSDFVNGKWTKIRKLNNNINTRYWESHACLSHDGKTLYFTSNRPGGYGGLDIYKSQRTSGDDWGPPQNLGPVINSAYNEDAPFITASGKRLYFSSFGHETMGGYDIFYSDLNANGKWTKPVNLGFPLNTTGDELFFCPVREGNFGYCSVYDPAGYGKFDIVRVEIFDDRNPRMYKVTGTVKLPSMAKGSAIYMALYDKVRKDTIHRGLLTGGMINISVKAGNYELIVSSPGYQTQIANLSITKGSKDLERLVDLVMTVSKPKGENQLPATALAENTSKVALGSDQSVENSPVSGSKGLQADTSVKMPSKTDSVQMKQQVPAKQSVRRKVASRSGTWLPFRLQIWEYFAIPGSFIVLILLLLIIKKRRKPDQN